jgi:polyhydroxyalkanoate synthase subunit PhaC
VTDDAPLDAEAWAQSAPTLPGSWWPDYDAWLAARSGDLEPAPRRLGGGRFKALAKAPGTYVHAA